MSVLSRTRSARLNWWWLTVDRWTLGALMILIGCGYVMVLASSPSVAQHLVRDHTDFSRDEFIIKQFVFLAVALALIVGVSMMSAPTVRRLALLGFVFALAATAMTLFMGAEAKGAARWIAVAGVRVQPSEFLKPCFSLTAAWLIARKFREPRFPGIPIALAILAVIILILKQQPDVGMMAVISAVFMVQLFIGGVNVAWVALGGLLASGGGVLLYEFLPHVHRRVDQFLYDKAGNYQIDRVMEAFANGGLFGRGPGEGVVKDKIPDVHADVVFAVVGEEFGMIVSLAVVGVFAFIVLRGLLRLVREQDVFTVLACSGLLADFGLQATINFFSTLGMMPTKGMTLPLISYGGSSAIAVGLQMGMLLSLTRTRGRDPRGGALRAGGGFVPDLRARDRDRREAAA
jgi:cell division protein FtsW